MDMDTLVISIQSKTTDATKSIGKLISSLKTLRKELDNVGHASKGFSNIKVGTGGSYRTSKNAIKTPSVEEQLKPYGLDKSSLSLFSTTSSLDKSIDKYKSKFGDIVTITTKAKNGLESYNVVVKKTIPNVNGLSSKLDAMKSAMASVQIKVAALAAGFVVLAKKVGDLVVKAGAEAEALNLYTVSMGEYAKEGIEWIDKFSKALYLDPVNVQQYMGSFNSLVEGLGVGSKNAYIMSKNLTQLVYDLSSFKNITIESAYEKLMSGISGELEPLRNVGVAMSEATLQNTAYSLGIETLVRNMTEAQKAQLRYIQIMKSSTEWQTDMGRTLITPTNAIRVMKQQFIQLGRAIGRIFIPIVMTAMPYIIALTQLLTELAKKIAHFLGYEIADIDYSGLKDITVGVEDIGNAAEGTAKKLNTMLAPFDDLNVVQKKSEGKGHGFGGLGGDLGLELPEYDALENLNKKFAEGVEDAKKKLKSIIPILETMGVLMLGWKISKGVINFFKVLEDMKVSGFSPIKTIGLTLAVASIGLILLGTAKLKNEKTFWQGVGMKLGGTLGLGAGTYMLTKNIGVALYVTGVSLLLQGIKDAKDSETTWLGVGETLGGSFALAGGTFVLTKSITLSLAVAGVSLWLAVGAQIKNLIDMEPTFQEITDALNEMFGGIPYKLGDAISDAANNIETYFEELGEETSTWWSNEKQEWSDNWTSFKDTLNGIWDVMIGDVTTSWDEFWVDTGNTLDENKEKWSDTFNDIKDSISTSWDDTWVNIGNTVETKWTNIKTWFSDHFGTKEDWKEKFKSILDGASDILNQLSDKFSNWKSYIKTPHFSWSNKDGFKATGIMKKALDALNLPTTIPKLKVNWYEDGGFPTSGDLFFANENGIPEMIGRMGNKAAVANNDQIAIGIANGVRDALQGFDFGNKKSPTTIYIGSKKVYEGYGDYISDENDRYGTNMIRV